MAVTIENLRKTFALQTGKGLRRVTTEVVAVDGISLTIPTGQCVAFIGPNGAGKSTTIKILTGILRPTTGSATVLGLVPWIDRKKLVRHIGAVFGQRSQLWYHLPPRDTFELLARIYDLPKKDYTKRKDMLIERFGIGSFLDTQVRKLSLGLVALRNLSLFDAAISVAGSAAVVAAGVFVFYFGLRRYESGNLMEMRG
jgi:ABC-2 type transport system ATP-binding protein